MANKRVKPADCRTMVELRQSVDDLDRQIVTLLAERFRYMAAAARIKPERHQVRDEERKAQVIRNARMTARAEGLDEELIASLYDTLIETSIAYEFDRFDEGQAATAEQPSA